MKNSKVIFTIMVLIMSTVDSLAQTQRMMPQNIDTSINSSVIHVFAKWKAKEGQLENVLNFLKIVHDKSIKEKGNLFYKIHRDRSETNTIILFEGYLNENALKEHKRSVYYQAYILQKIIPLLASREVVITTPINL